MNNLIMLTRIKAKEYQWRSVGRPETERPSSSPGSSGRRGIIRSCPTRRGARSFSKLGFTVQLVPRYALLVRDQGRARGEGRSNRTILTQSRGCERHAAPLHSTPLHSAPCRTSRLRRHIMPACARRRWRCERPRLDSTRLARFTSDRSIAGRHADNDNPPSTFDARTIDILLSIFRHWHCSRWSEWSVTEIAGRVRYRILNHYVKCRAVSGTTTLIRQRRDRFFSSGEIPIFAYQIPLIELSGIKILREECTRLQTRKLSSRAFKSLPRFA